MMRETSHRDVARGDLDRTSTSLEWRSEERVAMNDDIAHTAAWRAATSCERRGPFTLSSANSAA